VWSGIGLLCLRRTQSRHSSQQLLSCRIDDVEGPSAPDPLAIDVRRLPQQLT
jgi:hypothetical protein